MTEVHESSVIDLINKYDHMHKEIWCTLNSWASIVNISM